ncbi:MAG: hypothetical protein ABL951_00150 [Alphaproteobacteria bacterium]
MKYSALALAFAAGGAVSLAACGTVYRASPPSCAGINQASLAYDAQTGQIDAKLCGGKENERVKLSGKTPDGIEFLYEAEGAKAFAGQMTQAEMNEALSVQRGETIRELINAIKTLAPFTPAIER